jgi:hypothetical protein
MKRHFVDESPAFMVLFARQKTSQKLGYFVNMPRGETYKRQRISSK